MGTLSFLVPVPFPPPIQRPVSPILLLTFNNLISSSSRILSPSNSPLFVRPDSLLASFTLSPVQLVMDKLASSLQELSTGDDNREVPGTEPAKDLAPAPGSEGASSTAPQPSLEKLPVEIQRLILCNAPTVKMLSALVHASPQLHGVYADDRLPILRQVLAHSLEGMLIEAYGAHLSGMESFQRRRDESTLWVSIEELEAKYAAPFVQTYKPSLKHIIQLSDFHTSVIEPLTEAYASWALASLPLSEETARNPPGRLSNTERRRIQRAMYRLQLFCNVCGSAGEIIDGNLGRLRVLSMFSAWEVEEILSIHEFAKDKYSEAFQKVAWDLNEEKNPKYSHIDMTSVNEFLLLVSDAGSKCSPALCPCHCEFLINELPSHK